MVAEGYPGEQRGLRLFLEELRPALEQRGGCQMLRHAIRRALDGGDLVRLRHARQLFNHLPRAERQALSAALIGPREPAIAPLAPAGLAAEGQAGDEHHAARVISPVRAICFETAREPGHQPPVRVALSKEPVSGAPVRVAIEAGTLPSVAADALRRIAAMLEADRRLLSGRFWDLEQLRGDGEQRDVR